MSHILLYKYMFLFIQKSVFIHVCGDSEQNRIIGGTIAKSIKDHPYMASLQTKSDQGHTFCGGSILNRFWILTAAHCLRSKNKIMNPKHLVVVVGLVSISEQIPRSNKYYVRKLIIHSKYSQYTRRNDIGLVKLKKKIKFGDKVRPVKLPNEESKNSTSDFSKSECVALGWGRTGKKTNKLKHLNIVMLPVIDYKECSKYYPGEVTADMICTYYEGGGKDTCYGDSGGPLLCDGRIIGITSWGEGCAKPKYPGVYTRVDHYLKWIERVKSNQFSIIVNYLLISATLILI